MAEDHLNHAVTPFPGLADGRMGLKHVFRISWDETPGYHAIEEMIAEGDLVVTRPSAIGKHGDDLFGIRATGAQVGCRRSARVQIEQMPAPSEAVTTLESGRP